MSDPSVPHMLSTGVDTASSTPISSPIDAASSQFPSSTTSSLPNSVNLGPLTTAFSQPSSCANIYVSYEKNLESWVLARDQACTDIGPVANTACFPSSTTTGTQFPDANFYSPGVACPIGYAQVASSKLSEKTLNWCCPTNFQRSAGACFSTPTSRNVFLIVYQCNEFDYGKPNIRTYYLNNNSSTYFISVLPIQQSLYATVTAQQVLIALNGNAAFTTFTTSPTTASPTSTNRSDKKKSFSPGAVTGIVIALVIFVGCAIILIWWHRKRKSKRKDTKEVPNDGGQTTKTVDDAPVQASGVRVHDLYAKPEDRSSGPANEPNGEVSRTHGNNKANQTKLHKIRADDATGEQEPQISEATAMEGPQVRLSSGVPGNYTPPDSNEVTMPSGRHVVTQGADGDDADTISEGDTQMGTPRTGEISETASIVIGNLPKPEVAPRDYQIADLEYRLSELRRLKMLEEEQAKREAER